MKKTESKASVLIAEIEGGLHDAKLIQLYQDHDPVQVHRARCVKALTEFIARFGDKPVEVYSSPGRSEICGNHCDHQNGCVIATCVDADILAVISRRDDALIHLCSEGYEPVELDLAETRMIPEEAGTMAALIRGMAAEAGTYNRDKKAAAEGANYTQAEISLAGFDAYLTSRIPSGSGMSSSAAFEMLLAVIFLKKTESDFPLAQETLTAVAKMGQRAENQYFGKPSGLMDQLACASGGMQFFDFKDPESPIVERMHANLAAHGYRICLVNTGGSHADLTNDYAAIPEDMKKVASFFSKRVLREVPKDRFWKALPELRKQAGDRAVLRAMHFFAEMERVAQAKEALQISGDPGQAKEALQTGTDEQIRKFLEIENLSGKSSYQLLQNIVPEAHPEEQSLALALALSDRILSGAGAVRVHGGGFAGTIQAFVPEHLYETYRRGMEEVFGTGAVMALRVREIGPCRVI